MSPGDFDDFLLGDADYDPVTDSIVPRQQPTARFQPNAGQRQALDEIRTWAEGHGPKKISLTGCAGVGKTRTLQEVSKILPSPPMTMWTGMTGKAATRMRAAAGVEASTLHKILYEPPDSNGGKNLKFNALRDPEGLFLIVDESSMVTPQIAADLDRWCDEWEVRILFVGDSFQLPPVISKDEEKKFGKDVTNDYSIFKDVTGPVLTEVMRNGDGILDAATLLRTKGSLPTNTKPGSDFEMLRVPNPSEHAMAAYLDDPDDHMLITWINTTRMGANLEIRRRLGIFNPVPQVGEPILVCKNGIGGSVLNGEVYEIAAIDEDRTLGRRVHPETRVVLSPGIPTWSIRTTDGRYIFAAGHNFEGASPYFPDYDDWKAYRREINQERISEPIPITYGHVLTAHKSQGSEARRVTVFLPRRDQTLPYWRAPSRLPNGQTVMFGTRWLYTAISRAKQRCSLVLEV
jgi:hypothetical protein